MLGPNDHEVGRTPSYPGVYIDELPGAVHLISGVSTSVTAFVGFSILLYAVDPAARGQ